MKYLIKRNIVSLTEKCTVLDQDENDLYVVKRKVVSWGNKYSLQDLEGKELAFISQKVLSLMPVYVISKQGKLLAKVKQKIFFFNKDVFSFKLIIPNAKNYLIKASFKDRECKFYRDKELVSEASKGFFSRSGLYSLDITHGEDEFIILAACIVLDRICDRTFANFEKHCEWD